MIILRNPIRLPEDWFMRSNDFMERTTYLTYRRCFQPLFIKDVEGASYTFWLDSKHTLHIESDRVKGDPRGYFHYAVRGTSWQFYFERPDLLPNPKVSISGRGGQIFDKAGVKKLMDLYDWRAPRGF